MADSTNKLRTLSLFSGIGGIDLGLQRWCKTVCYCEIDPYACGVLIKNMAKGYLDPAPIWSDVTTFGPSEIGAVGPIECITGGFPCQDISCAGKGAGIIAGETRSGLFHEIIRIVRLARPKIIFLENVSALLNRGMDTVLRELSESGYDAVWKVLSAAEVGAPHKRDRVWIMAKSNSIGNQRWTDGRGQENAAGPCGEFSRSSDNSCHVADAKINKGRIINRDCKNVYDTIQSGLQGAVRPQCPSDSERRQCESMRSDWWTVEPDLGRVAHGIPFRVDRLKCLGNSVVPKCAKKAFEILINHF